jgi:hypothetical protein
VYGAKRISGIEDLTEGANEHNIFLIWKNLLGS